MPYQKTMPTTYMGNIVVGAVSDSYISGRKQYAAYGGVMPSIHILKDTTGNVVRMCKNKPIMDDWYFRALFNEWSTDNPDVATWKERMESCTVWVYGSLDDGGLCLSHVDTDYCILYLFNGLYQNIETHQYSYHVANSHRIQFAEEYEFFMAYIYDEMPTYQNECRMWTYNKQDALEHQNAVWIGVTSPSYAVVGNVYTFQYLQNGGFRFALNDDTPYPNSCIEAMTASSIVSNFYDDAINEIATQTHLHVSGTVFSGAIHDDKNSNGGYNGEQGGGGDYPNTQDGQTPTDATSAGILGTGILTLYAPSVTELQNFSNFLYASLTDADALALKKLFSNPMDYIIGLNMCHLDLSSQIANTKSVHLGGIDSTIAMSYLSNQIICVSGGSLSLPMPMFNFLAFSPYLKAKIYIPYCGEHDLPIDWVIGGVMNLTYNIDLLSGALTAQLSITRDRTSYLTNGKIEDAVNNLFYTEYTGNIFIPVPLGSVDNRGLMSSLLGIASATATSIATSNPMPLVGSVANAAMNSKPTLQRSGSIGSCYGYMLPQCAQITIERAVQNLPLEFSSYRGYPSNTIGKIGNYTGLIICDTDTFWSNNFTKAVTDEEVNEIKQLLNSGIWIDE